MTDTDGASPRERRRVAGAFGEGEAESEVPVEEMGEVDDAAAVHSHSAMLHAWSRVLQGVEPCRSSETLSLPSSSLGEGISTLETLPVHDDSPTLQAAAGEDCVGKVASQVSVSSAGALLSAVGTSIAISVRRTPVDVIDADAGDILDSLASEAAGDERYLQTLRFAFVLVTEGLSGGLIIAVIPKERKSQLRFQTLDEHYMLGRLLKDARHGMNIHRQQDGVVQALGEFAERTDSDCWPMDHQDLSARGHPKDGGVVLSKNGTVLAAAARFEHSSTRWSMASAGTRHNSALALAEWLQDAGVVFVRSDRGTVHVMVPKKIHAGVHRLGPISGSQAETPRAASTCQIVEQRTTMTRDTAQRTTTMSRWSVGYESSLVLTFKSMVSDAARYTFTWRSFATEISEAISRETKPDYMPLLQILVVPLLLAAPQVLTPMNSPESGLSGNLLHQFFLLPFGVLVTVYPFAGWFGMVLGEGLRQGRAVAWSLAISVIVTALSCLLSFAAGVYPVPFVATITCPTLCCMTPFLLFCVPSERRRGKDFRKRLRWALAAVVLPAIVFGLVYPALLVGFLDLDAVGQGASFVVLLLVRILIERIGEIVALRIGMQAYPTFVFSAVYVYEIGNASMASGVKHPYVFAIPVVMDLIETAYYLYCISRQQWSGADWATSRECIVAVLTVREFIKVVAPLQVTTILGALSMTQAKRFNCLVAHLSHKDLRQIVYLLLIASSVHATSFAITAWYLRTLGLRPLEFLRGFTVSAGRWLFTTMAASALAWFLLLQHSHNGCDWSLEFSWVSGEHTWDSCFDWY